MSQNKDASPQTPTLTVLSDDSSLEDESDLTLATTEEECRGTIPDLMRQLLWH